MTALTQTKKQVRKRPAVLQALGNNEPPDVVLIGTDEYRHQLTFKHDSWAATALYANAAGNQATCKFNRVQSIFGFPMTWVGRFLARREAAFLIRLADVELVPNDLGPVVVDGRILPNTVARVFIDGDVFKTAEQIDEAFFDDLKQLLAEMHKRHLAYVDLHKRENIIVDRQGRPNLIDFQVSVGLSLNRPGKKRLSRYFVSLLQEMDEYHYRKHYARCLGENLTEEERQRYLEPPWFINAHRKFAVPLRGLRRKFLVLIGVRDKSGMAHSEFEPEDAFREKPDDRSEGTPK